jgi:mannan endo-1,4-beta-mannosidase
LLTVGTEGTIGTENAEVYKDLHSDKNVDYLTIHIWPKNWGWFTGKRMEHKMDSILRPTLKYIQKHEATALKLNKPLVLEEFGLPRNGISFSIDTATTYRDIFYKNILATWQRNKSTNGPLAGINFWAYGGQAKPVNGQVYWKPGDDYMGDPPFEEQGLYTVFNGDTSTWQIIESFTGKKPAKKTD